MKEIARRALIAVGMAAGVMGCVATAEAGSETGDVMVRGACDRGRPRHRRHGARRRRRHSRGGGADVSTEVIPALTLSYFFNPNIALELFCCFAKHDIKGAGSISNLHEIADNWIFPRR